MIRQTIRPIETSYRGYRFRSRLEARWAVYFDAVGLRWEYELQGYDLGPGMGAYLPDFWLPDVESWAEVKAVMLDEHELLRCAVLVAGLGYPAALLVGAPAPRPYGVLEPFGNVPARQLRSSDVWHDDICVMPTDFPDGVNLCDAKIDAEYIQERRWYMCCGGLDFPFLEPACRAARRARFEHDEIGSGS